VNQTSLTRRLAAGAAGLAIGVAGVLALTAPAQAGKDKDHHREFVKSDVEFVDSCESTYVFLKTGNFLPAYQWSVTAGGEEVWAGELAAGENNDLDPVIVPADAGEIVADFQSSPNGDWPKTHTWVEPEEGCDEEPEPEPEPEPQPEEPPLSGEVAWEFDCETITLSITNTSEADTTLSIVPSEGDAVDVTVPAGETSEDVSFDAAEGFTIDLQVEGESVLEDGLIEITSEEWAELGCEEDDGAGGELPTTGSSTTLIAGGAVALLALGGGLFLVARRRRVTFTA
jgi:LPXTG-motif cell wall-anchored protein